MNQDTKFHTDIKIFSIKKNRPAKFHEPAKIFPSKIQRNDSA